MIKNLYSIKERISNRKKMLQKQLAVSEPMSDCQKHQDVYKRRVKNAAEFLDELEEVEYCMASGKSLLFTSSVKEFEKKLSDASMHWVTFEGNWCKLAVIYEEVEAPKKWLMYVSSTKI